MKNLFKKPLDKTSSTVSIKSKNVDPSENPLLSKIPESMKQTMQFIEMNNSEAENQKINSRSKEFINGRPFVDSFMDNIDSFRILK